MADSQDRTCTVAVHNVHGWELDMDMLRKSMEVSARYIPQCEVIDIYPQERVPDNAPAWRFPGRLEWIVRIKYRSGTWFTIGLLQRQPGAEIESHS